MRWQVRWAPRAEWLRSIAKETGVIPQALTQIPELEEGLEYLTEAFIRLTSSRQVGFNVAPIPMSEIKAYVEMFPVPDDLETFVYLLREMDNEYLKTLQEREKAKGGNST